MEREPGGVGRALAVEALLLGATVVAPVRAAVGTALGEEALALDVALDVPEQAASTPVPRPARLRSAATRPSMERRLRRRAESITGIMSSPFHAVTNS
jgi:predicted RecB family endonuclease